MELVAFLVEIDSGMPADGVGALEHVNDGVGVDAAGHLQVSFPVRPFGRYNPRENLRDLVADERFGSPLGFCGCLRCVLQPLPHIDALGLEVACLAAENRESVRRRLVEHDDESAVLAGSSRQRGKHAIARDLAADCACDLGEGKRGASL
jgi:hypothetical protein